MRPGQLTSTQNLAAPVDDGRAHALYLHRCRVTKREGAWVFRCRWCRYGGLVKSWRAGVRSALRHAEAKRR